MRRLPILKTLVNILFGVCLILIFFGFPLLLITIVFPTEVPFDFFGRSLNANHFEVVFLLATVLLGHSAFTYGIYLFRKTLDLFAKKKFFNAEVITLFDQSGKAFIAAGMLWIVPPFFYQLLANNEFSVGIDLGVPFFAIALGFFFMVLSEIFLVAKAQKEENDLTV